MAVFSGFMLQDEYFYIRNIMGLKFCGSMSKPKQQVQATETPQFSELGL